MTALQRMEPGDPRAKAIEAMAARCGRWNAQWRDPENGPFDGDESDYLRGMAAAMLESGLAALEQEGLVLTDTREVQRLRGHNDHLRATLSSLLRFARGNEYVVKIIHDAIDWQPTEGEALSSVPVEEEAGSPGEERKETT